MGRVAVDFYAEQIGSALEDAQSLSMYLGGCPANISVGASRLGLKAAILSRVGTDDMGVFLRNTLIKEGVDTSQLVDDNKHLTALVILGVNPPDRFPLIFYRENCADMQIKVEDIHADLFRTSKAYLFSGTCLSTPEMQETTHFAIKTARENGCAVILDIDYRPVLWKLTEPGDGESRFQVAPEVSAEVQRVLADCDLIVGTEEEILCAGGGEDLGLALDAIRTLSDAPIVQKRGEEGCVVFDKQCDQPIESDAFPVEVLNVLGAGDSFMAGFLRGWLRGESWEDCGKFANANGALVVSRHGCAPAMASFRELEFFMDNYRKNPEILVGKELELLHREPVLGLPANEPMTILAFDHRVQFEQSCDELGIDYSTISAFKSLVYDGFRLARDHAPTTAILVDPIYGKDVLRLATPERVPIGLPIEASGQHPIRWIKDSPLYHQILERPADYFIKVLWKYHSDMSVDEKAHQMSMLKNLSNTADLLERRLMLELIIPDAYPHSGVALSDCMTEVYRREIFPYWWKVAGVTDADDWAIATSTMESCDPDCRIIILGKDAHMDSFAEVFRVAKSSKHATGFAIGRTIFWQAWLDYAKGELDAACVPDTIAERYKMLIDCWKNA